MPTSKPVIETRNLSKFYNAGKKNEVRAVDDLNLQIYEGEIFGFLGPNGAGKTTTIRMMLDLIRPTKGGVLILNLNARDDSVKLHRQVGFLPAELNLWKGRSGKQVIHYLANLRGDAAPITQHADELADRLKLDLSKNVRDFSTGNKRKLGLVIALMHKPDLLILDEPTSGLDPLVQQTFNQMMIELRNQGKTIFLSSHVLSEVQTICDRVGILRDGKLRAVETVDKIMKVGFRMVNFTMRDPVDAGLIEKLQALEAVHKASGTGDKLNVQLRGDFQEILSAMNGAYIKEVHTKEPSLEEIFLSFYGNGEGN